VIVLIEPIEAIPEGYIVLSEAWGLADLLYKLFSLTFQCPSLIAQPEGWYPFAPILARPKASNLSP
jgi:hypothetical protein